jgi:hypothetical protein
MRARIKRRQRIRTITIAVTIIVIAVSLVVGFYIALNSGSSALDKYIGVPVSSADMASLYTVSHGSYGSSGSSLLVSSGSNANLRAASGQPFTANGKPVVVYIGGDFCPYCAVERWSLIMAFSRFGNFSNLHYMTSSSDEGDYATFTFTGSSYSSKYVAFQTFEQEDRNRNVLTNIPANYSAEFTNAYPFVNFGNRYLLQTLIPDASILAGKNWTRILSGISTTDATGALLKEGANAITALVCRLTSNLPTSVCNEFAVSSTNIGLAAPFSATQGILAVAGSPQMAVPASEVRRR